MNSKIKSASALKAFDMAHKFLWEYGIRWLPVDPFEVISSQKNWKLKYADALAYEIGRDVQYVPDHVMRSDGGVAMYDPERKQYDIILNNSDGVLQTRMLWTAVHEIGHIYLGHLDDRRTQISAGLLSADEYDRMEFEADIFAGEVLASKWLMRQLDVVEESDITLICGISGAAARRRYKKATEDYNYMPANITLTLARFAAYLKNIAICKSREELGDFERFAYENRPAVLLPKPKPPFLRRPGNCPYCGNDRGISAGSLFCTACGKALVAGAKPADGHCGHINHEGAAFCEMCGNRVYRIRQGFCLEECEVL
jgi:Zn-dependent peptidase ImmA (M78 family)